MRGGMEDAANTPLAETGRPLGVGKEDRHGLSLSSEDTIIANIVESKKRP